jgi:hypothetical protein
MICALAHLLHRRVREIDNALCISTALSPEILLNLLHPAVELRESRTS